jgi:hypothetical protein
MIDAVGGYFLGRVYVRDFSTLRIIAATLIFISLPSVIFFLIEKSTGKNIFYIFGGVFENTLIREGRLRCQGPFSHPIMAGVFWASAFSLMFSVWQKYGKRGQFAILGIFSSFAIVVMTTSSTPAMALILSILFLTFYPLRKYTPIVWLAGVAIVAVANFTLEKGIFHLLSRVNLIGGSTGQ